MQRTLKHREEETAGKPQQEAQHTLAKNIDDLTDKIILAILDHLESNSPATDVDNSGKKKKKKQAPLSADELRKNAARTVSQVLLSSTKAWEMTSSSSAFPNSLASVIALDSMLEAMAQSGFPADSMRSLLDSTSHDITDPIAANKNVSSFRNFILDRMTKRIHERVKTFLTVSKELVKRTETEFEQDTEPCSASHPSHIDDLTIMCTHDVIDGIIQIYHPHGGDETKEVADQGVKEVMQELENIVSSGGSSSKNDLVVIDLEENQETSPSYQQHESLLSDSFHQKVKHTVSDALLKTTGAVSTQFNETLGDIIVEDLEMCAEQSGTSFKSSALVEPTASDITETIIEDLKKVSSHQMDNGSVTESAPSRNTFRSAAYRLYSNVHFKVFGFLLRLQESHFRSVFSKHESTKGEDQVSESAVSIRPPPHQIPRIQVQECSCTDEVCVKVKELYKSEVLLSSSSYRRAFSSAAQTMSAADSHTAAVTTPVTEAVERNFESRNTARSTMNSSREMFSRLADVSSLLSDVSSPTEGPRTSNPFFVFRRVKTFFTRLFTGAGRTSSSHTSINITDGEDIAASPSTKRLIEDLLLLLEITQDYLTQASNSPGLSPTASNKADNNITEDYESYSSSSNQVDNSLPMDPDPATEKKKGLGFRKRLARSFSAIRRALPNPFQCMTGP